MEWHAVGTQLAYKTSVVEEYWVFLYKYFAISLIKLFYVYVWRMMLNWCYVTNNKDVCYFYCLYLSRSMAYMLPIIELFPSFEFFSPIDVFLFFDDLGIFDCIYAYKPSLLMYSLHRWIIELTTMSTAITTKQQKRNRTHTIDIHFNTNTWKSLVNLWWALSTHVKTRRIEAS